MPTLPRPPSTRRVQGQRCTWVPGLRVPRTSAARGQRQPCPPRSPPNGRCHTLPSPVVGRVRWAPLSTRAPPRPLHEQVSGTLGRGVLEGHPGIRGGAAPVFPPPLPPARTQRRSGCRPPRRGVAGAGWRLIATGGSRGIEGPPVHVLRRNRAQWCPCCKSLLSSRRSRIARGASLGEATGLLVQSHRCGIGSSAAAAQAARPAGVVEPPLTVQLEDVSQQGRTLPLM